MATVTDWCSTVGPTGSPIDAEPGHRTGRERLGRDITAYITGLLAEHEPEAGVAEMLTTTSTRGRLLPGPCHFDGPGLEL